MTSVRDSWQRIGDSLSRYPAFRHRLAPGASEHDLRLLEQSLGHRVPDDLRESLGLYNGYLPYLGGPDISVFAGTDLCSTTHIASLSDTHLRVEEESEGEFNFDVPGWSPAIQPRHWWVHGWIPVLAGADQLSAFVVDLAPTDVGTVGQVFYWSRYETRRLAQPSWEAFLELVAILSETVELVDDGSGLHQYGGQYRLNEMRGFGGNIEW